jgi:DNA-binding MarR family transcriptional regulator
MKKGIANGEVARFLDAWFAVRQFIQAANFNRFQGAGLSATQFMTLNLLPAAEGISMGELARRMNLKPATVAKTVDSLEARGMVTRIRKAPDKRTVFVKATKAGVRLQNEASDQFHAQIEGLFDAMRTDERADLIVGLESFVRASNSAQSPTAKEISRGARAVPPAKRSSRRLRPR